MPTTDEYINSIVFKRNWNIWDKNVLKEVEDVLRQVRTDSNVILSFEEVEHFTFSNLPVLLVLAHCIHDITKKQIVFKNICQEIYGYLDSLEFFILDKVVKGKLLWEYGTKTTDRKPLVPIRVIHSEEGIRDFAKLFSERVHEFTDAPEAYWRLRAIMTELLINCKEHSIGDSVEDKLDAYVFCDESEDKVCVLALDFGIGFLESIWSNRGYKETVKSHGEAIIQVLKKNISRKENGTGAAGYKTITQILDESEGRLLIASGDAIVVYKNGNPYILTHSKGEIRGSTIFVELSKK